MKINRRQFTALASTLLASPLRVFAGGRNGDAPLVLSAASDADDRHWVIGFRPEQDAAQQVFRHRLPARAHHIAIHEGLGIFIVLARRPGNYLWVGDLATGQPLAQFSTPDDRHLYGHGVFSPDGSTFYTTENAWQLVNGDSGRVAVWDVSRQGDELAMVRSMEFPSYGTGPHELLLNAQQGTLVVANGGIRTHPQREREKLNIDSMLPSLAYIETVSGQLMEQQFLDSDYHKNSIRHLDRSANGLVAMGMQYQGEPFDQVPLVGLHRQGEALRLLWAPEPSQGQMSQYVGSVRFDTSGSYLAATCPRGNMITFWDAQSGHMLNSIRSRDGCGVCAVDAGFIFTAGTGRITRYDLAADSMISLETEATGSVFWDNHLSVYET